MGDIVRDSDGSLYLAAGQVAQQPPSSGQVVFRGAASGNRNFDPVTGKFAGKKKTEDKTGNPVAVNPAGLPQGMTKEEYDRRRDVVREAARLGGEIDADTMTTFLKGRVADLSKVNVQQFVIDVREAMLDDLADALQAQFKGTAKGMVKVTAPSSYFKRVFNQLDDAQAESLVRRMRAKGWTEDDVKKNIVGKIRDPERKARLEQTYGEVNLSDPLWNDSDPEYEPPIVAVEEDEVQSELVQAVLKMGEEITANMRMIREEKLALPEPRPLELKIVRNKDGLIETVRND